MIKQAIKRIDGTIIEDFRYIYRYHKPHAEIAKDKALGALERGSEVLGVIIINGVGFVFEAIDIYRDMRGRDK